MKEGTNSLVGGVVVLGMIALFAALFFTIIWPHMKSRMDQSASCSEAVCDSGYNENHMMYCRDPKGSTLYECPYRG